MEKRHYPMHPLIHLSRKQRNVGEEKFQKSFGLVLTGLRNISLGQKALDTVLRSPLKTSFTLPVDRSFRR